MDKTEFTRNIIIKYKESKEIFMKIEYNSKENKVFWYFGSHGWLEHQPIGFVFEDGKIREMLQCSIDYDTENMKLEKRIIMQNGKKMLAYFYHENGNLKYEMNIKNYRLHGDYRVYDEDGNLVFETYITGGTDSVKIFDENGLLIERRAYKNVQK